MMTMGGEGSIKERLLSLHLVPLAISYEYDPCDFLKAQEFQLRRDVADWKKGPMDDVISMQTGIMGYKGHIHYHAAPCIDEWLRALPDDMPNTPTAIPPKTANALRLISTHNSRRCSCPTPTGRSFARAC